MLITFQAFRTAAPRASETIKGFRVKSFQGISLVDGDYNVVGCDLYETVISLLVFHVKAAYSAFGAE